MLCKIKNISESECCLHRTEQFFSYMMVRTN